jgi:glucose-1-phosphate thymidylyltransferase
MKGIILAGGRGQRLAPLTSIICKPLLPIYDKPMLYYPLSVLMQAGIRDIAIISTPEGLPMMRQLLGDGAHLGLTITYILEPDPRGIAQAFILAESWLAGEGCCLILGDNLFYSDGLPDQIASAKHTSGASVFAYRVHDAERYGVVEFDEAGRALSIEEKPKKPRSDWAVTGVYVYDSRAPKLSHSLKPSARGELEITDLNNLYLAEGTLTVEKLGRGTAWLDTGTVDSLLDAAQFVAVVEARQGMKIACLEEIAYTRGYITHAQLSVLAEAYGKNDYGQYLQRILREGV